MPTPPRTFRLLRTPFPLAVRAKKMVVHTNFLRWCQYHSTSAPQVRLAIVRRIPGVGKTEAALPHMLERNYGRIVNIASVSGKEGLWLPTAANADGDRDPSMFDGMKQHLFRSISESVGLYIVSHGFRSMCGSIQVEVPVTNRKHMHSCIKLRKACRVHGQYSHRRCLSSSANGMLDSEFAGQHIYIYTH